MNDNDDENSIEMYVYNTQSQSKQTNIAKRLKTNVKHSVRRQRQRHNFYGKSFVARGESFIHIGNYNHYLRTLKFSQSKKSEIITINVSGDRYPTRLSTLENYPNTLLGDKNKRKYYWNNLKKEYYFDRHRACFEAILYYYQSNGRLRRPDYVPLDTFLEEVSFFDLGPDAISQINKLENVSIIKYIDLPNSRWRRNLWFYFQYPQNSLFGRIIFLISIFFTLLSSITLAIETLPEYNKKYGIYLCQQNQTNNSNSSSIDFRLCPLMIFSPFFLIQTVCVGYFTIEFLLRLLSTPSYIRFFFSIFNWIDLGAIIPYFVFLALIIDKNQGNLNETTFLIYQIFRALKLFRVFRIYLLFKQFKSLRVLTSTLKESFTEFFLLVIILTFVAFIFGSAIYFAEQNANGNIFDSIPRGIYLAIVTITTVGYGDIYPITVVGRILTCMCAFLGAATSAMLVSVLVDRYQRVYNRKQFSPEQIMSAVYSSDNQENFEKQDFINRKLSQTRKNLSSGINLFNLNRNLSHYSSRKNINNNQFEQSIVKLNSSSYLRFIITLTDNQNANQLMTQLNEIIRTTGDQIHLQMITTKQLSIVKEE